MFERKDNVTKLIEFEYKRVEDHEIEAVYGQVKMPVKKDNNEMRITELKTPTVLELPLRKVQYKKNKKKW